MRGTGSYSLFSNLKYIFHELKSFSISGIIISFLEIPAKIMVSLVTIYSPKIVLDAIQRPADIKEFTMTIIFITLILAAMFIIELYSRNTAAHCANAFVLTHMQRIWLNKAADMDYEAFTSEEGKQKAEKARAALEDGNRGGLGTYFPRFSAMLMNTAGFISYSAVIMKLHPLAVPILIVFYLINLGGTLYVEKIKQASKDDIAKAGRKLNYIAYRTRGLDIGKDIRIYSMAGWLRAMALKAKEDNVRIQKRIADRQFILDLVNIVLVFIRDGGAYAYLIYMVLGGHITIGDFVLYFAAITGLGEWFAKLASGIGEMAEANNYVTDFISFIDIPDHLRWEGKELPPGPKQAVSIDFENISYAYDPAKGNVLESINLHIKAGEKLAVVGSNGAGKTTIIKIICGLIRAEEGRVLINGIDIDRFAREDYYAMFSAVFQDSGVLPVSIADNIALNVGEKKDYNRIQECIALAGLSEKIKSLPAGLETKLVRYISEDGMEFSGGETQKLLLARALYKNAPVIILDEPTAALDPIAENQIYQSYNELIHGRTAIFISHRLSSTRFCDRIILISDKGIAEAGTHDELMALNGKYAEMFRVQSQYYKGWQGGRRS